jgi:hypothetical protein
MKDVALFIALSGCLAVGLGLGILIGRAHPYHHYERFGDTRYYLLDSSTGKVCNPFLNPNELGGDMVDSGQKDDKGFSIMVHAYPPVCDQMKEK